MRKVLVLEDEENIRSFVVINLKRAGYQTVEAGTGEEALEVLKANPDVKVALLDVMLPGIDGFEVCRRIRAMDNKIGIIMLTARAQEMDKVTGLMTGADDYVTKPFSPAELTARVDALFRRTGGDEGGSSADEISDPPFLLNTRNRTLEKNGQRVKLTQVEYSIVKLFMENPGKALSREEILDTVWGKERGPRGACPVGSQSSKTDLCEYGLGIRIQVGRLRRSPGIVLIPPHSGGGRQAVIPSPSVRGISAGGIHFRRGQESSGAPAGLAPWGANPQKPTYVNTVWGYGYKCGAPAGLAPWGANPQKPTYVNTVWGYGYKWGG